MKNLISILLVEDDKDDQEFFIDAINEIDNAHIYDVANNGREALVKLENPGSYPDLIFMDINMPLMGGIECLTCISQNPQISNIPVIILSSSIPHIEIVRSLGARGFMEKPDNGHKLRTQLEVMINTDFMDEWQISNNNFTTMVSSIS